MTEAVARPTAAPIATDEPARQRVYYPELDGLRFVAFMMVYLFHNGVPLWGRWTEGLIRGLPLPTSVVGVIPPDLGRRFQANGWAGVQLFFALSGFLIGTLLLREEVMHGRIDLKSFWVRRILRIWPLYYLTLLLATVALPLVDGVFTGQGHLGFLVHQGWAFLLFLGNWSMAYLGPPTNDATSVLWSVCVEEQFYLFCPLLIALVPRRLRLPTLAALIGLAIVGRYGLALDMQRRGGSPLRFQFSTLTHLDTLLGGVALAALLQGRGGDVRTRRAASWLEPLALFGLLALLVRPGLAQGSVPERTWGFVGIWLLTCLLLATLVMGNGPLKRLLAYERFVWLGKISYGLYMYHEITLWLGRRLFAFLGWFPNREAIEAIACLALTVGVAALSYYAFERPFLLLKGRWTRVPSRPV